MIITRKLGKIFRGKATSSQLILAALIGTSVGFMPGFIQAPGLLAMFFLLALILNANLVLLGLCLVVAKLLSFALLPVSFAIGRFLLDGPAESFFALLVNAPILALFGFEYYATTGGLVVGLVLGALFGVGIVYAVQSFRRKMASLEANSEKWTKFTSRFPVRAFTFVFIGGSRGKASYEELLEKKGGSPIRPLGIAIAVLSVVAGYFLMLLTGDEIAKYALQTGLERTNGATVDVENVEFELRKGRISISGLALADPNALGTDLFRADLLEGKISQADLLRKRLHIENLRVASASNGAPRASPGILIHPEPVPEPEETDEKSLDDYVQEAQKWKDRLGQVSDWLEKMQGESKEVKDAKEKQPGDPEREIRYSEYKTAVASHLIEGSPTLLVSRAIVEQMKTVQFPGETLEILAENFSTHPGLVEKAPKLTVRSSGDTFHFDADLVGMSATEGDNTLELTYLNLPVDSVTSGLKFSGENPIQGGTLDVRGQGNWTHGRINFPLEVTVKESQLMISGRGTNVDNLVLPIEVTGSLRSPRINFSADDLTNALTAAGKAEVARRLESETDKLREKAGEKVGTELLDRSKGLLDGFSRPKK